MQVCFLLIDTELRHLSSQVSSDSELLTAKLRTACNKLKEKSSEAHSAKEQLDRHKKQLLLYEKQLTSTRKSLADCQQEIEATKSVKTIEDRTGQSEVERLQNLLAQSNEKRRITESSLATSRSHLKAAQHETKVVIEEKKTLSRQLALFTEEVEAEKLDYETRLEGFESMFQLCDHDRQALKAQCEQLEKDILIYMKKNQRRSEESNNEINQREAQLKRLEKKNLELTEQLSKLEQQKLKAEQERKKAEQERKRAEEERDKAFEESSRNELEKCKAEQEKS
ncbi:golgin subfamily A member 6-like protein 2 [Watersipora subatra]|uniref:golgin subfamily A member 6-like protein 2 n=1 Tax=Watersipora subatra TaxID=2589382 RepID=UPI00355B4425